MTHYLTAWHGDQLTGGDFRTLETVRRTLLGLMSHGTVADFETYSNSTETTWSYNAGDEDPAGIMLGLVDTLRVMAPGWAVSVRVKP